MAGMAGSTLETAAVVVVTIPAATASAMVATILSETVISMGKSTA